MWWLSTWLVESVPAVDGLLERIGALLVGNRSFRGDHPYKGVAEKEGKFAGSSEWSGPQFVLIHHPPSTPVPGVTFVTDLT